MNETSTMNLSGLNASNNGWKLDFTWLCLCFDAITTAQDDFLSTFLASTC